MRKKRRRSIAIYSLKMIYWWTWAHWSTHQQFFSSMTFHLSSEEMKSRCVFVSFSIFSVGFPKSLTRGNYCHQTSFLILFDLTFFFELSRTNQTDELALWKSEIEKKKTKRRSNPMISTRKYRFYSINQPPPPLSFFVSLSMPFIRVHWTVPVFLHLFARRNFSWWDFVHLQPILFFLFNVIRWKPHEELSRWFLFVNQKKYSHYSK